MGENIETLSLDHTLTCNVQLSLKLFVRIMTQRKKIAMQFSPTEKSNEATFLLML